LDIAIAGGLAITVTTADVTLTITQGTSVATNIGSTTAQYAILNVSGAMTAARNLIVPSSSRQYVINNNTTGGFLLTVKGSATTGVTLVNGEKAHVFWNGSDYAKLSNAQGGAGTFSSITNTGLTATRVVFSTSGGLETDSANLTFSGTILTSTGFAGPLNGTVGATTPAAGSFTSLTDSGNLTFTGTGNRITGDFSNATFASRVMFQTSTANSNTAVEAIPSGTGVNSTWSAYNNSDPTNASFISIGARASTDGRVESSIRGTGTYLPMTFYTGGSERMRLDTSGNVGIGTTSPPNKLTSWGGGTLPSAVANAQLLVGDTTGFANAGIALVANASNASSITFGSTASPTLGRIEYDNTSNYMRMFTNSTERMRIDSSGNVLVTNVAGLGYGTGSGGTVTQATDKSTAVTLNKPTGQITMNAAALLGATAVVFRLNDSLIASVDTVIYAASGNGNYEITTHAIFAGAVDIRVTNATVGSLSEALVINFSIIKGATA
jgi:hypothetical protein